MSILFLLLFLMVLVSIAFVTLLERKILGYIQLRKGPNKLLIKGVLQPMADGLKLFLKENFKIFNLNKFFFMFFPFLGFVLMLIFWFVFNFNFEQNFMYSVILIVVISGVGVYSIMGSGWSSNSKYALLGAYRSVAQTISYEVSMIFIIMSIVYMMKMYSLESWVEMKNNSLQLMFGVSFLLLIWIVVILAELNRAPFDFAEGESELVSGFNVEYGSSKFALFFLAEYGNIIFMCYLTMLLFFGNLLMLMTLVMVVILIWIRGVFPRYRYDNLMNLTWKMFLPFILMMLLLIFLIMFYLI